MGLKHSRRIVEDAIDLHKQKTYSPYSVYLEGPPNFLTWLAQDKILSTQLMGSNVAYSSHGLNSPIKYSLINNLPAWKLTQITLDSMELTETSGTEVDINGELILAPGTIVPVAGDMFTINYLPSTYIFEVTDARPNIINSNHYYKVEFQLKYTDSHLEEKFKNNIFGKYECIYENIGTDLKSVILSEEFNIRERLKELNNRLLDYYYETYYESITNCFVNKVNDDEYIYNQYLVEFINKNNIFTSSEKYSYLTLTFEADKEKVYNNKYRQSIYGVIESKKITDLNYNNIINLSNLYPRFSVFSHYNDVYKISLLLDNNINMPNMVNLISEELYQAIKENKNNDELSVIERIIFKYLTSKYIISDLDIPKLEEYYNDVNNLDYNITPLIIFLINKSIEYYTAYKAKYNFELDKGGIDNL